MIDSTTVERIFAAADIAEVVGDFVTLKKKGVNYQACCPFHNEKTPSFVVSPSKGLFKCFGCGKGGNAVTFVMSHENMSYVDALKYVAKKYNIEVQERELSEDEVRRNDDRESMMIVSSYASDYFKDRLLNTDEGKSIGLGYFRSRGFSDEIVEKFHLGYCPSGGDTFTKDAIAAGYKEDFLVSTGLTIVREQGGYYDRFSGRVIFPIFSISGRVIAFGGRTLRTDKNVAKYLNSPESEIYHKSDQLYGLFQAKKAITQEDYAILVEGYTDVMSMFQAGVENVVASSGTSLTEGQIRLIARFTKNVTVIYDGDAAGIKASLRGIDMLLAAGLNVRVVPLSDGDDPDSFARKHNAAELKEYIRSHEEDFISFKTRILLADSDGDPIKKAALVTDVVQSIASIPEEIPRSIFIKESAKMLDVDAQVIANEVVRRRMSHASDAEAGEFIRRQQQQQRQQQELEVQIATPQVGRHKGSNMEEMERELIKYLLKYGDESFDYVDGKETISLNVADVIITELTDNQISFVNSVCRSIYEEYLRLSGDGQKVDIALFAVSPDQEMSRIVTDIIFSEESYTISLIWKKFGIPVHSEADSIAADLPRLLLLYKSKAIEHIITQEREKLKDENLTEEQSSEIVYRITILNREKTTLSARVKRNIL